MIPLPVAELVTVVRGTPHDIPEPPPPVTGPVVIDSREAVPGALFAALPGERVDGHDFAGRAVAAGAAVVLATRPLGAGVPTVVVDDVTEALGALAQHTVRRLGTPVIALTGSSGKTSTKDLTAQLLERVGPTVYTAESFNNEIGLPLTALRVTGETRHLLLEMGARGIGHIRYLTTLAPPTIGMVLNVGTAHLGEFGSREAIAEAKGEIVETLPPAGEGGVAILNADDPLVRAMSARTRARVLFFGEAEEADIRAEDVHLTPRDAPRSASVPPPGAPT